MYDVVVLGQGAVGASVALMLAQLNYKVAVIEKKPIQPLAADFQARTVALSYASEHILSALEVWNCLSDSAHPIEEVSVSMQGKWGGTCLKAKDEGVKALGYVIALDVLEQVLSQRLQQYPQVDIFRPAILNHYQICPNQWELTFCQNNKTHSITSRLLVASDGIDSSLRKALSIPTSKKEYGHYGILCNVTREHFSKNVAIERFLPAGAIALLPFIKNYATMVLTVSEGEVEQYMAMDDEAYLKACQTLLGMRHGKLITLNKRQCLKLNMQIAKQQKSTRFLLMGNAAHSLHPIAAQGLNLSLRDLWQFRSQIINSQTKDIGCDTILESYVKARSVDQGRIIFATDKIAKFMSGGVLPASLRAVGISLFDSITPLKTLFTRYSMGQN